MEPALKVATQGVKNNNIVVMATPLTLKEKKFETLMHKLEETIKWLKCLAQNLLKQLKMIYQMIKHSYRQLKD